MKKSQLKQIIREEITNIVESDPISQSLAKRLGINTTGDYSKNTMKEKEYKVGFFYSDGDYDTIKVKASSPDNALEKAKDETPFGSKGFKIVS